MKEAGIELHAITSEKGGKAEVLARLAARDTADLPFTIHCDEEMKLKAEPAEKIYVETFQDASKYGGTYEDYQMLQPVVIVSNKHGEVEAWWSWRTMVRDENPEAMQKVTDATTGDLVPLVTLRPKSIDIISVAKEGRSFFAVSKPPTL